LLELQDLHKTYEGQPLLKGISMEVGPQEIVALLGPSGSGKSTILRIIAGLEPAEAGRVLWQGSDLAGQPAHRRGFGLMFQDYALFPHRSVEENVAFGLQMQNLAKAEVLERSRAALAQVGLTDFARRRVTDLSGGEQQRVALARALAPRPRLLMLDEPLGALDRTLREQLGHELRHVLRAAGIPAVYVTHDQEEAFAIADRLILLNDGRIAQQGAPAALFASPASSWVARFMGLGNLVQGTVLTAAPLVLHTPMGEIAVDRAVGTPHPGETVWLLVRPEAAQLKAGGGQNRVLGVVDDVTFRGATYRLTLLCNGVELEVGVETPPQVGSILPITLNPAGLLCLPA